MAGEVLNPITIIVGGLPVSASNPLPVTGGSGTGLATLGANTFTATQTITPAANTPAITISGYSLTAANAQPVVGITGTWNTSGNPDAISLDITNTASGATANLMALGTGGLKQFRVAKDGTVVAPNVPAPVTWATKPASPVTGFPYFISDVGVKGSFWYYDGARWKPFNNQTMLASLDAAVTGLTNVEVVTLQYRTPAGMLQIGDRVRVVATITKSGAVDAGRIRVRLGTLGTTGDSLVLDAGFLGAAARHGGSAFDFRVDSATSWAQLGRDDLGYGGGTSNSPPGAFTVANISNQIYINVGAVSSGATNTVGLSDVQIWLLATAN